MTRHPSTPAHQAYRTPIEDSSAFDRLKELSAEYWSLIRGDETAEQPGLDVAYEAMWEEAITQTRKGWATRRGGWTALVAGIARCTPAHLALRASDGWEGDTGEVVHEMRSSRTRSSSGAWSTVEPTDEERAELADLTRLAEAYWRPADKAEELRKSMIAEAVRLVRVGQKRKVYGQTAAVARVTGWSREHCSRLAKKPTRKARKTAESGQRDQRRPPAAA